VIVKEFFAEIAAQLGSDGVKLTRHFPHLVVLEEALVENSDLDDLLQNLPVQYRDLVDLLSIVRSALSVKEVQLERLIQQSETAVRLGLGAQKATLAEVRARAVDRDPQIPDLHGKVEALKILADHLREIRTLALMRRDILLERSRDRRKAREDDRNSFD